MATRTRSFPALALAAAALALLATSGCKTAAPSYGGMMVDVRIRIAPAAAPEVAAGEPEVEGWVIDLRAWKAIDGRNELPRLAALRREGDAEGAARLNARLSTELDRRRLAAIRRADTTARLPATTLYLIARAGEVLAWKEFDSTVQREVTLEP
jgi:hypothetical protein